MGLLIMSEVIVINHFTQDSTLISDFVKGVGASFVIWGFFQLVKNKKLKSQV